MKNIHVLLFALILSALGFGQTTIYTQDFEVLDTGYLPSNTEGSTFIDVFNRIDASAAAGGDIGGNSTFIWAVEDTNETPGSIILSQIDVTGYSDFTFSVDLLAHHFEDWDSTDEVLITYSVDGGASQNLMWVQMVPNPGNAGDNFNGPAAIDTDFDGAGDCDVANTLPALTTGTEHGCTVSSSNFATFTSSSISLSGNSTLDITIEFNGFTAGDEGIYLDNIAVEANMGGVPDTSIQFDTTSASVSENVGTYDLVVEIANEDAAATNFDVVLTSGDAADIDSYVTQSETFPGSSTTDINVTITVTDDAVFESDEVFTFEIQNVTGGNNAAVGINNSFELTIINDDAPPTIALPYTEDFSDCGAAQWTPFDESGTNSWACAGGEYSINGFPNTDDRDWLISGFSIDFDLTSNENIAITTNERWGNTVNESGEFELLYSTDYAGFGDPTGAIWNTLTFDPNNTSTNGTASADSVTIVDASGITGTAYLAFVYDASAGPSQEEWNVTEILIQEGALPTEVNFISTSASVAEDSGTIDLNFSIANEDGTNDTTFDVVLIAGDAADIDSYTTQVVTFTAGSNANQSVTITITDDILEEMDEVLTFEIQNVAGGNAAAVGANSTFDLTILANDEPVLPGTLYDADFSNDGDGFPEHSSSSPPAAGPASAGPFGIAPNQWILSYDTAPNTDGGGNTFEVAGGALQSRDWGGQGIFTSQVIDVTSINVVDITAEGLNVGANDGNFTYFYILDGGSRVDTAVSSTNGDPVNYSVLGLDVSGATSLEVGFEFSENGSNQGYDVSEFLVIEGSEDTTVQFTSTSDTIAEDASTYDLTFEITFEDATNATDFDVVLISGDAADLGGYITQSVSFPAGTSANQTATITITDDMDIESTETFIFEIQNVTGGSNAMVGINTQFELTIQDNDGSQPVTGDIVISEIMYNTPSTDDEWIELYNASGSDITLDSSWELSYGSDTFTFSSTVITAGDYITVALGSNGDGSYNNDNPFIPDVSAIATPVENTNDTNNLGNGGATITLVFEPLGTNITVDTVTYDDGNGWPTAADGNGPSLELIDVTFDNSLAASWVASGDYDGGTPGSAYVAPVTYTFNGTWTPSDPNGNATASDDIVIASGDATIVTNTTCNSVTVNPGAGLTVNTGISLTTTSGVTLESISTSYSSLILDGTIDGAGAITYDRHVNINGSGTTGNNDLISAPLTGQSFADLAAANTNILNNGTLYLFGPFEKNTGTYVTWAGTETSTLDAGVGYRAATSDNSTVTFTGIAGNGIVTNDIINGGTNNEEWNLIGNPYPSYLNVQAFLTHDVGGGTTNIELFDAPTAAIWGYDGSATNGWTIYNLATTTPSTVIAPGQGFFVSADASSTAAFDVEFTPDMRSTGTSDDFIVGRTEPLTFVSLYLSNQSNSAKTEIYFNTNASESFDRGYDAELWGDSNPDLGLYSHLVKNNQGKAIALQTLNPSKLSDVTIPIGVNANLGEQITFSIDRSSLPENVNVYLEDRIAKTSRRLNDGDYKMTPSSDLSGTGQFFLRITENEHSSFEDGIEHLSIYAVNESKELIVNGHLSDNSTIDVFDIQGRKVLSTKLDNSNLENRVDVSSLNLGIYIATVETNGVTKTQKVIIK